MATTTTTLGAAVAASDRTITVASATSIAIGRMLVVGDEVMVVTKGYVSGSTSVPVRRGQEGTVAQAHVNGANVTHGIVSDFSDTPVQGTTFNQYARITRIAQYAAAGAITLPKTGEDLRVILVGTDALAMTIADPGEELDGCELAILSNGTAAHTLTFASGLGGESTNYDVITMNGSGPVCHLFVACNGYWHAYCQPAMTGTVTNIVSGIA